MDTQTGTDTAAISVPAPDSKTIYPIPVTALHVSPLNMRAENKEPNLKRMAVIAANILPTIREQGILTPLIVRPNNTGFEIIAGRRRFYAARVVEAEKGSFPDIRCDVREGLSDAEALEISLTENLAREDADELTYYEAFLSLTLKGRSVGEIARTYGKKEREVEQYLALANLLPRIREIYRDQVLDAGDLRLLTMATKTQQREWLKLFADNDCPTGNDLKGWLFGGAAIRTKFALFDLGAYPNTITGDLFGEDSYFDRRLLDADAMASSTGFGAEVTAAMEKRLEFLGAEGLARRRGQGTVFARDLLATLRQCELDEAVSKIAHETGLTHQPVAGGDYVAGTYRNRITLASGRFAMIDDGLGFQLVPWRPSLDRHLGEEVKGRVRESGVEWNFDRKRGLEL